MKIIHTGDIHIGAAMGGLPREKAALRKTELLDGFYKLCSYAKQTGVEAVIVAGDLFDKNDIPASLKKEVFAAIANAAPTRFFYASGNHDYDARLGALAPENFYTFSELQSYELSEGVTVTGCDMLRFSAQKAAALELPKTAYNIFVLHGDTGSEIPLAALQNKHIDYLALGHIHKPMPVKEPLDTRGFYRYCGCLEGRGFDELGPRGFFLLELVKGKLKEEKFLSLAKRTVHGVSVDISACRGYMDIERAAEAALASIKSEDMVKLVLCGSYQPDLKKDISLLCARLSEKFFFVKAEDRSRLFIDYRAFENDLTERGEFVREVGRYAMSEELREEILEVGLKALCGEEIDL
ncbi:MAG: metallophosphoesterase [Clostridia bacterium]|nr:metallophosphoesterase [Clostridia bacterium]